MSEQEKVFEQLLKDAEVPTTAADVDAAFQTMAADANYPMTNANKRSPFWLLITRAMTEPVVWLVRFCLLKHVLPNSFLMTARRAWLELICRAFWVERHTASAARGQITVTRRYSAGEYTLSAGTVIQSPEINGKVYELITDEDTLFADGISELRVNVTAAQAGSAYNLNAGYYTILKKPLTAILKVANDENWLTAPGVDEESDDDLRERARAKLQSTGRFHIDNVYRTLLAENFPSLGMGNIWLDSQSAPRGAGTADIYILLEQGEPSAGFLTELNAFVQEGGWHGHGDGIQVFALPKIPLDLTVAVRWKPNTAASERTAGMAQVEQMIRCAFRENAAFRDVTRVTPRSVFAFSNLACELHDALPKLASVVFSEEEIVCALDVPELNSLVVNDV